MESRMTCGRKYWAKITWPKTTFGVAMSDIDAPVTAQQDRQYLCMDIAEYQHFAKCLSQNGYLNRQSQICLLKNAKTKKLKNIRANIRKSDYLMKSLIWTEQMRLIQLEIKKRTNGR